MEIQAKESVFEAFFQIFQDVFLLVNISTQWAAPLSFFFGPSSSVEYKEQCLQLKVSYLKTLYIEPRHHQTERRIDHYFFQRDYVFVH